MKIVGHRGARGLAPENTIEAINKGISCKVDMVEFDLRVTKDNVVVLSHNSRLKTPDGRLIKIPDLALEELRTAFPNIPTLEEVLESVPHKVKFMVEVKRHTRTQPIIDILKKYLSDGWKANEFIIGSKNQKILMQIHNALPQLETIVIEPWSGVRGHRRMRQLGTNNISMNQLFLWWGFIKPVTRSGINLYTYSLNDVTKATRWQKWGLAGVITDYPDRYLKKK